MELEDRRAFVRYATRLAEKHGIDPQALIDRAERMGAEMEEDALLVDDDDD